MTSRDKTVKARSGETLTESARAGDTTLPAGSELEAITDRLTGTRVGRYLIGEAIGHGGMGVVYRARDPELGRELAIKVVLPQADDVRAQERLLGEARAMAKLRHPAVVPVFDVGTTEHGVYVVMPLVGGGTMYDWLTVARPWREVATRFLAAGRGLAAAHAAGLVHRDFKPRNVLVDEHGAVMVADFGLASESAPIVADGAEREGASSIAGTPAYMAPEQAAGVRVDARADQYSFCVAFWEALHGRRPKEPAPDAITERDRDRDRDREATPEWLRDALERGLAREPEARWPSMTALLDEIERRGGGVLSRRRSPAPWIAAGGGVLAAGAATIYLVAGRGSSNAAPRPPVPPKPPPALGFGPPRPITRTGGCAGNPMFVDDRTIVFELTGGGDVDLYATDVDGATLSRLTSEPGWEWRPAPGRNPREVVFVHSDPADRDHSYVGALDLDTHTISERIGAISFGIGSFGDTIYYADNSGTELRKHQGTQNELVATFPRSGLAAFTIDRTGTLLVYTGARSGPICHRRLPAEPPVCAGDRVPTQRPALAPGGDGVYVGSRSGIHRFGLADGHDTTIARVDAAGGIAISPDQRRIAISNCQAHSTVIDISDGDKRVVDDADARNPAVGPAGLLAWVRVTPTLDRVLMIRDPDGTIRQLTTPGLGNLGNPTFNPDGTAIAFEVSGATPGIYAIDVMPGHAVMRRLTDHAGDAMPAFLAPDHVAFLRTEGGIAVPYGVHYDGGTATELPDRSRPMLTANPHTGELFIINTATIPLVWWNPKTGRERPGPANALTNMQYAAVSPNGRWLILQSGTAGNVIHRAALPDGDFEKVLEENSGDRTFTKAAITDDGHIIIGAGDWTGELSILDVTSGSL